MSVKQFMDQITEIQKRIDQQSGDIEDLKKQLDLLMIMEFEEEMREENDQQLLKG
jgi:regulator of replication initiation timing